MAEYEGQDAYSIVTLIDRAATGGTEFIYDGKRITFRPGEIEKPVPQFVALWLFQQERMMVHTTEGAFVCRFAVKGGTDEFKAQVGPDAFDDTPIEIDQTRVEGWNTDAAERGPKTEVITLKRTAADYQMGGVATAASFGKER